MKRDHPEPEAFAHKVIRGKPERRMAGFGSIFLRANLSQRKIGQLVYVDQALNPEERCAMMDGVFLTEVHLVREELSPARRVDYPGSCQIVLGAIGFESDRVRAGFRKIDCQTANATAEGKVRVQAVEPEHLSFKPVTVELIATDV